METTRLRKKTRLQPGEIGKDGWKLILGLVLIELLSLGYTYYRGVGFLFLQALVIFIPMSALSCFLVLRYRANRFLVVFSFLLLNFGFVAQYITSDNPAAVITGELTKYLFAFVAAYLVAFIFMKCFLLISADALVPVITVFQLGLWAVLFISGVIAKLKEEDEGQQIEQTAIINLKIGSISVQPMEVIKVLYVFVIVILLCKEERQKEKILGIPRDIYMILYTMVLAMCSLLVSEMGSFLIMLLVGGMMLIIYSPNRKGTLYAGIAAIVILVTGWNFAARFLRGIGVFNKMYIRFTTFLRPELAEGDYGFQGLQARKALTMSNLFGADAERYIVAIPRANDDMIFANIVQTCGIVMGVLMILAGFAIFYCGYQISVKTKDSYFSGMAMGISLLFATELIVHVGYNIGVLPITGIPFYLVSEGVTSMTTGLAMIAILEIISTQVLPERNGSDEEKMERNIRKMVRRLLPRRKRIQRKEQE